MSWRSYKHSLKAKSTMESEYIATAEKIIDGAELTGGRYS
jgi:hypothetical protein